MMLSDRLLQAMNEQVGHEFGASLAYVAIAAYFDREDLNELGRFFYRQAEEERDHAMKFVRFIVDAGGVLAIPPVPECASSYGSARDAVAAALANEKTVTEQIYALVDIATEDSNYMAVRFLDWFVNEQFEEVSTMSGLLGVVERAGEDDLLAVEEYLVREGDPHADA